MPSWFASSSSYVHPVKPTQPLTLAEALARPRCMRAWTQSGRLLCFEAVEHTTEPAELSAEGLFSGGFSTLAGEVMSAEDVQRASEYVVCSDGRAVRVRQTVLLRYTYEYAPDGAPVAVTILNPQGKETVLPLR
jgi:hypothetical protein